MRHGFLSALTLVGALLVAGWATPSAEMQSVSTPDGALFLTIDLQVDPAKIDEFLAMMIEAAPATRARDGTQNHCTYVDQDKPGHVVFYEIWDSKEQQQAYLAWRQETGFNAKLGPYMMQGGGGMTYFTKVDG